MTRSASPRLSAFAAMAGGILVVAFSYAFMLTHGASGSNDHLRLFGFTYLDDSRGAVIWQALLLVGLWDLHLTQAASLGRFGRWSAVLAAYGVASSLADEPKLRLNPGPFARRRAITVADPPEPNPQAVPAATRSTSANTGCIRPMSRGAAPWWRASKKVSGDSIRFTLRAHWRLGTRGRGGLQTSAPRRRSLPIVVGHDAVGLPAKGCCDMQGIEAP